MKETRNLECEREIRERFSSSDTYHGGSRIQRSSKCSKHITAVVLISAFGRKVPPLFIIAGKNIMSGWFYPLNAEQVRNDQRPRSLSESDWFPGDGFILISENGSMESRMIKWVQ
eukprot:IDg4125t1